MDAKEPIDLERVDDAIKQAHQAEDRLLEIAPGSINPAEDEDEDARAAGSAAEPGRDKSAAEPGGDKSAAEPGGDEAPSDPTGSAGAPSDEAR